MNIADPLNPTKLPIEDVVKILELYKTLPLRKVSKETGRDIKTIQKILEANGVEARKTWTRKGASNDRVYAFDDRLPELKARYEAGESSEDLAAELGVPSASTMLVILRKAGAQIRSNGPRPRVEFRPGEVCCGICKEWVAEKDYDARTGSCKSCARRRWLKRAYGITPEQYDAMLTAQGGVCSVCGSAPDHTRNSGEAGRKKTVLCVDHDHATGKVRGLLCSDCNRALGLMDDKLNWIQKLGEYISKY